MLDFSLFFVNRPPVGTAAEYELLLDSGQFVDASGFRAIWLPERHFHPPEHNDPGSALVAAALAMATRTVRLRAASAVLPLHDPLQVVEDWAFVDNLSRGRVDVAVATGADPDEFVLAAAKDGQTWDMVSDTIEILRRLWTGGSVVRLNHESRQVDAHSYQRPVQPELGMWLTCCGAEDRFAEAGAANLNVLTSLRFGTVDDLATRIRRYREARARCGLDPGGGTVTLALRTFVGESDEAVRELVRAAVLAHLRASAEQWREMWTDLAHLPSELMLEHAFNRYLTTAGMFGSVERCVRVAQRLHAAGVDELACWVEFGAPVEDMLNALPHLAEVRRRAQWVSRTPL